MDKNKRNKIIGLSIGILVVLIIVVSSTYAYWQITKTQKSPNDIVAACLSLDLKDASTENTGIDLDSAWPISDEEGKTLTGYTFTVTNNCAEEINYIVGLNRVEASDSNYLLDSSIKLQLDDNSTFLYSDLSDVDYADAENTEYTARSSKQVSVETIGANGTNTHTIRVWISESAPVTEQSKNFLGQVFITGGQGIEVPECFTIANNGTILSYDYSCGTEVKVPAEINGIQVKGINQMSFAKFDAAVISAFKDDDNYDNYIYYKNLTHKNEVNSLFCDDSETCDLESMGFILINSLEEYNVIDWNQYIRLEDEIVSYSEELQDITYSYANIKSLDLSEAIHLETIGYATLLAIPPEYGSTEESLEELVLPENALLTYIGKNSFGNNQLKEVTIPSTVTEIDNHAFENNEISSLVFKNTESNSSRLKRLGYGIFRDNEIGGVLVIPDAVEEIDGEVFANNKLTKVIIPASVNTINSGAGYEVFKDNPNLTEIIIKKDGNEPLLHPNSWPSGVTITYDPNYTE